MQLLCDANINYENISGIYLLQQVRK